MPIKKTTSEKKNNENVQAVRIVAVPKVMMTLAAIFLVTWTLIGISLLLLVVQAQRKGTFKGLTNPAQAQSQTQSQNQQQVPEETEIPGVGRVNIACVQNALPIESIQKLLSAGNISALEGEERTKFEACLAK